MKSDCPFCSLSQDNSIYSGNLVFAIWDRYPVSPGHALIIPRRHCATWFDATPAETAELIKFNAWNFQNGISCSTLGSS
jgi:diadenosine tetraphosphate (Ap4A) HIT family hydrolase